MKTALAVSVTMALVGAAPLAAQHNHGQPAPAAPAAPAMPMPHQPAAGMSMMGMDSMMAPMHRMAAFAPSAVLGRGSDLALTTDQVARIEALGRAATSARDSAMAVAARYRQALTEVASTPAPDPQVVEARFVAMHEAMGRAHAADLRAAAAVMGVLTDVQRGRLAATAAHAMPEGMMPGREGMHQGMPMPAPAPRP